MSKDKIFFIIQAILRYVPFQFGLSLRSWLYPMFFKHFGKHVRIFDSVVIKYPSEISLGDHVTINQFCYLVGKGGLHIGDDVMIGSGTKMTTSSHDFDSIAIPMRMQGISFLPIEIGNDVWFGFNTVVLGGSKIAEGSIVATGCVVNGGEFPKFAVLGGIPVKIIKIRG